MTEFKSGNNFQDNTEALVGNCAAAWAPFAPHSANKSPWTSKQIHSALTKTYRTWHPDLCNKDQEHLCVEATVILNRCKEYLTDNNCSSSSFGESPSFHIKSDVKKAGALLRFFGNPNVPFKDEAATWNDILANIIKPAQTQTNIHNCAEDDSYCKSVPPHLVRELTKILRSNRHPAGPQLEGNYPELNLDTLTSDQVINLDKASTGELKHVFEYMFP